MQGLRSWHKYKVQRLKEMMEEELNCRNLSLTETHSNASTYDAEIVIEGFPLYRADRDQMLKGGVAQ